MYNENNKGDNIVPGGSLLLYLKQLFLKLHH